MATAAPGRRLHDELGDPRRAIGGPTFDALLFWGAPLVAALSVWVWGGLALALPPPAGRASVNLLGALVGVLTFSHLIAVVPRAYGNHMVFSANRLRLTIVPALLVAALLLSPQLLLLAGILTVFWDVHHSAMQTFGLGRIYDMKAGNDPHALRRTDLALNWALYVGPIATGAALLPHFYKFRDLVALASAPGLIEAHSDAIRLLAVAGWSGAVLFGMAAYRRERSRGYAMPAHKKALIVSTGLTSILAWSFAPPFMAFAIVNIFHAVQYFAIVWLKEGKSIGARLRLSGRAALAAFLGLCALFGLAYAAADSAGAFLAPFIACSLLHFWYDSFVWSVRKKQV
jgi:hypothetical protein